MTLNTFDTMHKFIYFIVTNGKIAQHISSENSFLNLIEQGIFKLNVI